MYRAPLVYRVARPFRAGAHDYAVGDVVQAEDTRGLRLSVLVSARYLLPDVDPYARRAWSTHGKTVNSPTTITGDVMVATGAADPRYVTVEPSPAAPEVVAPIVVPEGMTVQQTLDWVGGSLSKAQAALDYEQEAETPRSTLVTALTAILADG